LAPRPSLSDAGACEFDTMDRLKALAGGMRGRRLTWGMLRDGTYGEAA